MSRIHCFRNPAVGPLLANACRKPVDSLAIGPNSMDSKLSRSSKTRNRLGGNAMKAT